jgi:hypothetical protein
MTYDVLFRHQQALDPSALTTVATTLHAIEAAITDCRNAGCDVETDSAVVLLIRHLEKVCASRPESAELRRRSMNEITRLRRSPALRTLALRGVAHDEAAKRTFLAQGRTALIRLAEQLGLDARDYDLRTTRGAADESGEIVLHGDEIWVRLRIDPITPGQEVTYRRVRGRRDEFGDRSRRATVADLLVPELFAARLRRDLSLSPSRESERLSA